MADRPTADSYGTTVLALSATDRLITLVGLPSLGLLLGLVLPPFARWAIGLSVGLPLRPLFRLFASVDQPWEAVACAAGGLTIGLTVAYVAVRQSTTITLTDTLLRIDRDDRTQTIARVDATAVFLDGRKLVVLDRESRQLLREIHDVSPVALAAAFREHGYPWRDEDPFAELYQRWSPGTPELPAAVDAVLAAREVALKKKAHREIRDLRDAVANLGFVVRDDGSQQFWRPLVRS